MLRLSWALLGGALLFLGFMENRAHAFQMDLYLGVEPGYSMSSPDNTTLESKKSGYHMGVKVVPSLYFDHAVLEGAVGWFRNSMEGTPKANPIDKPQDAKTVTTQAGFGEFSARWRMTKNWEIGPLALMAFGTETDFSPRSSSQKSTNSFVGLQLLSAHRGRDSNEASSLAFRWGLSALRSVTIKDRAVTWVNLNFHIGFTAAPLPPGAPPPPPEATDKEGEGDESTGEEEPTPPSQDEEGVKEPVAYTPPPSSPPEPAAPIEVPPEPSPAPTDLPPAVVAAPPPPVMETAPALAGVVYFSLGSHQLNAQDRQQLKLLAESLMKDLSAWESIIVSGHTDTTGKAAVNQRVSLKRAQAVRAYLVKAGVPGDRIQTEGMGAEKTIAKGGSGISHARNRRAEVRVKKINQPSLVSALEVVRLLSAGPTTCRGLRCR